MKAAWIFVPNTRNENTNTPYIPNSVTGKWTAPLEIHRLTGGPAGFEHTHSLVGGMSARSADREGEANEHHTHWLAWYGNQYHQITVGATNHNHDFTTLNNVLSPDWFLIFWKGSDGDAAIINADPQCIVAVQAVEDQDGSFEDLDITPWSSEERTQWENRIKNVLAIDLPPEVNSGDKLIAFFCGALVSRPNQRERWLRFN